MLGGGGPLGRTVEVWCARLMCGRHGVVGQVSPPHADVCDADSDGSQIRWAVEPKLHARTETNLDSIEHGTSGKGSVVTG